MPQSSSSVSSLENRNEEIVIRQIFYHSPEGQAISDEDIFREENLQHNISRHEMRIGGGAELSETSEEHLSLNEEPEEEPYRLKPISPLQKNLRTFIRYLTQLLLIICWLVFTYYLMNYPEREREMVLLSVPAKEGVIYELPKDLKGFGLVVNLRGPFARESFRENALQFADHQKPFLSLLLQETMTDLNPLKNISQVYNLLIKENSLDIKEMEKVLDFYGSTRKYQLLFFSNSLEIIALELFAAPVYAPKTSIIIWGLILFAIIYFVMTSDLLHHTFAAIICSSLATGIVAAVHIRPSLEEVFHSIEFDVIMAFFGISLIMEILAETGLQDYLAAWSYEMANGHIWPLLNVLFLTSMGLALIFDDLSLILFLTPICLRLCEIMHLNCAPVLSCLIIAINLGCSLTPSSSITNYLIYHHQDLDPKISSSGSFMLHMLPASLLTLLQSYIHLRLQFLNSAQIGTKEPLQVERLKRLTRVWRKVSDRMGAYSLDERSAKDTVDTRIRSLRKRLKRLGRMPEPPSGFKEKVLKLRQNFHIKKLPLLTACLAAIFVRFFFTILNGSFNSIAISLGWVSILAALLCFSLCNYEDLEGVLGRIDWASMLFISALFIIINMLGKLGLPEAIGLMMEQTLEGLENKYRLTVAILSILGISSGLSLFLSNVSLINILLPIIATLARNEQLNLPLMPLVWSLALGCSLGANASLVSGVVNIACAGVASKHGYSITEWLRMHMINDYTPSNVV
ncbi:P protein-like [Musca vetustissima]|uniref:P protein-like n=1 Tax=Musca vetustissima TaxID=27455 RepID=UPI002AB7C88B|nr:P protein-like [Musca vetustissima]